jgi:superfamily II DNA or RNA helicase
MAKKSTGKGKPAKKSKPKKVARVSYHRRPDDLTLDLWQLGLRKQFGEENTFQITNLGKHPVFSEFQIWNPETRSQYRVHIRTDLPKKGLPLHNSLTQIGNSCTCQDFKTNRLGLCKHISAVLHHARKAYGAKKALKTWYRPPVSSIYVDYRNGRKIRLHIGSENESALQPWYSKWFGPDGLLADNGFAHFDTILEEVRGIQPGFICQEDAFDLIAQQRERIRRQSIVTQNMPKGPDSPYFEKLLKVNLFPYQKEGVFFATHAGRCLLADEMGLGKTIQAIGAAEVLRREMGLQKVIVVCPTSLKYQWKSEIEKFTDATIHVVEGIQTKRIRQYETSEAFYHIISYNTIANDADYISKLGAELLIIDEAQRIKNFRTKVSIQLKKVRTPYCFVLTGTPLENKLEELYGVTQFVDQYKLPPLYRFLDRYQIYGDNGQVVGYKNLKEIGEMLSDSMIRRQKKTVLKQLPKRIDKTLFVPMTKQQHDMHNEFTEAVAKLVAKWRKFHFLNETDRRLLLTLLAQMRMVADSTFILDQQTRFDTKIDEVVCIFEEALADPDQKIVIFSQWERMTRLVAQELEAAEVGYAHLHGGVHSKDRADLLHRFQHDPECRVFLSTDAGGVGLNLQSASIVINLDVPWNPAVLEQRIGRIHRMGQTSNVTVINMVSLQSIEQRLLDVLAFKSSMAEGVLDPEGDDTIFMSESKFKKFMDNVENITGSGWQPEAMPESVPEETAEREDVEKVPAPAAELPEPAVAPPGYADDEEIDAPASVVKSRSSQPGQSDGLPGLQTRQPAVESPGQTTTGQVKTGSASGGAAAPGSPGELIQTGISFLSGLAQTLSSAEKTQELVQSIVATDETTGQTYLKIPVESAAVVENAVRLLGGLLAGLGR